MTDLLARSDAPPALQVRGIVVQYAGLRAIDNVDVDLPTGSITGVIGPNGAGKTTLVNVLSGLTRPTEGTVLLGGRACRRWTLSRSARLGVVRSFQASKVFPDWTVADNVRLGMSRRSGGGSAADPLDLVGLGHRRNEIAGTLPYGELRRLGVAIGLSAAPSVLLLDEPGAGLTGPDLDELSEAITRIRDGGTTVLLVDHNMRFLMGTVDRVVAMESGAVIAHGSPTEVQNHPRVHAAYLGANHDS